MTTLYYNSMEYPSTSQMLSMVHDPMFWCRFPLFTKVMLHCRPHLACQYDTNGNLPLHIVSRYNWSSFQCSKCQGHITEGLFHWVDSHYPHCTKCETKCKRDYDSTSNMMHCVPLVGCHGECFAVLYHTCSCWLNIDENHHVSFLNNLCLFVSLMQAMILPRTY